MKDLVHRVLAYVIAVAAVYGAYFITHHFVALAAPAAAGVAGIYAYKALEAKGLA